MAAGTLLVTFEMGSLEWLDTITGLYPVMIGTK